MSHLCATQKLLEDWSASQSLQNAGLYHAAYGTAGFDENLVSTRQRKDIAQIIGHESEEIVYQYCACNRQDFFPRVGVESNPRFENRFTGVAYHLDPDMLKDFCELTAANEVEIAHGNPCFVEEHGAGLHVLFANMKPYLSIAAQTAVTQVFNAPHA